MAPEQLIAAMLAARSQWVPLPAGRSVRIRRPSEHDMRLLIVRNADGKFETLRADLAEVKRFTVDWDGFKEFDLVPGGADDVVPFTEAVFGIWVEDHRVEMSLIAQAILDLVIVHESAKQDVEKN